MGQVGSTGIYYTPPVPGGLLGQSAALAYARGARTPGEIVSQGGYFYIIQVIIALSIVGIIIMVTTYYEPKSTFIPGPPEKERYTAV
jgi:hypothetical protein